MNKSKTLVIMGTHPSGTRNFNWNRKDVEIWMFNEAPSIKGEDGEKLYRKPDFFFQLHHEAIWKNPKNRSDKNYYKWLTSKNIPPVYMQEKYQVVPKSIRYPIEDILKLTQNLKIFTNGQEKDFKYFSSTPDYAFALVAKLWNEGKKYKTIEVYGIELVLESEYVHQRMGFGFWIGYLTALGINVKVHSQIFNEPMYGYEGDLAISPQEFEQRIEELKKEMGTDKENYSSEASAFLESIKSLAFKDSSKEIERELNEITKRNERAGIINGKIKESERYLEKAKDMVNASGSSVFSPGEFDDNRINFQREYEKVRLEATILNAQIGEIIKKIIILKKGSQKRKRVVDEFGGLIAELMNKNMTIFHFIGGIQENQFFIDSYRQSLKLISNK